MEDNKLENKSKRGSLLLKAIGMLLIVAVMFHVSNLYFSHVCYFPNSMYYMTSETDEEGMYANTYLKLSTPEESNLGTFDSYIFLMKEGEEIPQVSIKYSFPCGYWKWKKVIGNLYVNNDGEKPSFVQDGFTRIDMYCAEGTAYAIDMAFQEIDMSDEILPSIIDTVDIGKNNLVYDGYVYIESDVMSEWERAMMVYLDCME